MNALHEMLFESKLDDIPPELHLAGDYIVKEYEIDVTNRVGNLLDRLRLGNCPDTYTREELMELLEGVLG